MTASARLTVLPTVNNCFYKNEDDFILFYFIFILFETVLLDRCMSKN